MSKVAIPYAPEIILLLKSQNLCNNLYLNSVPTKYHCAKIWFCDKFWCIIIKHLSGNTRDGAEYDLKGTSSPMHILIKEQF